MRTAIVSLLVLLLCLDIGFADTQNMDDQAERRRVLRSSIRDAELFGRSLTASKASNAPKGKGGKGSDRLPGAQYWPGLSKGFGRVPKWNPMTTDEPESKAPSARRKLKQDKTPHD